MMNDNTLNTINMEYSLSNHNQNIRYNKDYNEMVDMAYLEHLHNINQYQYWQFDIIPLTHYTHITNEWYYIYETIVKAEVNIQGPRMYNDTNISETHMSKIIEHVKLRIEYFDLCSSNFDQYKQALTDIYYQDPKSLEQKHNMLLKQSLNCNVDDLQTACSQLSLKQHTIEYSACNIQRILQNVMPHTIEVILDRSQDKPQSEDIEINGTNRLIQRIIQYTQQQHTINSKDYLVINCDSQSLVNSAYLVKI